MKKILLFALSIAAFQPMNAQPTVILSQNFNSSAVVADYVNSATPTASQFNAISTSGAGTVISINGSKLQFARTGNAGACTRTTDLALVNSVLGFYAKINLTGNSIAVTNGATFQFGSGFGTGNSAEANASVFARFGVNQTTTNGSFSFRDIAGSASSANFSGEQTIYVVMNKSASTYSYTGPDNAISTVATNKIDFWVGNTIVFNEMSATTSTVTPTDFKFVFSGAASVITLDDMEFTTTEVNFPIELTRFEAKAAENKAELMWQTASERDNAFFQVEHSRDGINFQSI